MWRKYLCTLDVSLGDRADHARQQSHCAAGGVGLRVAFGLQPAARAGFYPPRSRRSRRLRKGDARVEPSSSSRESDDFFAYRRPADFVLEERHPQLFPTNVRPETLEKEAKLRRRAAEGKLKKAQFLRFTSPMRTPYPENDRVNARWYPGARAKRWLASRNRR